MTADSSNGDPFPTPGPRGELQPKPEDLQLAQAHGKRVAEITRNVRAPKL